MSLFKSFLHRNLPLFLKRLPIYSKITSLATVTQKRPDVHKKSLSIESRFPPSRKKCQFEDFILICTVFLHFGPFSGGGETRFCGQEFYGHPDLSEQRQLLKA